MDRSSIKKWQAKRICQALCPAGGGLATAQEEGQGMTRRLLLLALPVALVLIGLGWMLCPRPSVTWENAAKIREGMTRSEVEAILGRRPGPPTDRGTIWHRTPNGSGDVRGRLLVGRRHGGNRRIRRCGEGPRDADV